MATACIELEVKWNDRYEMINDVLQRGVNGIELGVWRGEWSMSLLGTRPERLILVDCWRPYPEGKCPWASTPEEFQKAYEHVVTRLHDQIDMGVVRTIRRFSHEAAPMFPDGYFGWVYVDANHMHEYALRDMELYAPKLAPGGVMMCHDFLPRDGTNYGVDKAVRDFLLTHEDFIVVGRTGEKDFPTAVLRRKITRG